MKPLLMLICCAVSVSTKADPEWQIIFPDQPAMLGGHYVDHNQALVIKRIDGQIITEAFDLADITGLSIPDNTAVTGFTAINNGGPFSTNSFVFSLSTPVIGYQSGDVIECDLDGCGVLNSFGGNAAISALDYVNRLNDLYVSFDTGFNSNGNYIAPYNVYDASDLSLVFNASNNGINENNSINAYDNSELNNSLAVNKSFQSADGLIKPNQIYSQNLNVDSTALADLSSQITGIGAYYSVDSGWLEMNQSSINVLEGSGSFTFDIARIGGSENVTSAVVRNRDGTASDGVDYEGLLIQYNWIDGDDADRTVTVNVLDNNQLDGTRTFYIDLLERNNQFSFTLVNPDQNLLTVNIIDDDASDLIFEDDFE